VCKGRTRNRRRAARLDEDGDLGIDDNRGIDDNDDNNCDNKLTVCLTINYRTSFTPSSLTKHCIQFVHFSSRELHNKGVYRLLIVEKATLEFYLLRSKKFNHDILLETKGRPPNQWDRQAAQPDNGIEDRRRGTGEIV
jgi:hypothetical protein